MLIPWTVKVSVNISPIQTFSLETRQGRTWLKGSEGLQAAGAGATEQDPGKGPVGATVGRRARRQKYAEAATDQAQHARLLKRKESHHWRCSKKVTDQREPPVSIPHFGAIPSPVSSSKAAGAHATGPAIAALRSTEGRTRIPQGLGMNNNRIGPAHPFPASAEARV